MKAKRKTKNRTHGRWHGQGVQQKEYDSQLRLIKKCHEVLYTIGDKLPFVAKTFYIPPFNTKVDRDVYKFLNFCTKVLRVALKAEEKGRFKLEEAKVPTQQLLKSLKGYKDNTQKKGKDQLDKLFKQGWVIKSYLQKQRRAG